MPARDLCPEERMLSYSKYFYMIMDGPHPLARQIWDNGPMDPGDALAIEDINDLLKPGYLPAEQGYCRTPEGSGFVANYVRMPGVTVEMIDWWFVWHFLAPASVPPGHGNLRYKIWCPPEHWDTGVTDEKSRLRYLDPSLPLSLRRENVHNFIDESLGGGEVLHLTASGLPPERLGMDANLLRTPGIGTVVAAVMPDTPGVCAHYYRPLCGGLELRSRYWFGYTVESDGPARVREGPDEAMLRNFIMHNMIEYPHLAKFLPALYAEESWKPLNAY